MKVANCSGIATVALFAVVCGSPLLAGRQTASTSTLPVPSHIVIVMEENHSYSEIIGSSKAPYINSLASEGASFTESHAIMHPSQPNYLALFSGSTQGVTSDSCPHTFSVANLGSELIAAGLTFTGYAEGLPSVGSEGCNSGYYARKHVPWRDSSDLAPSVNQPFTAFPTNFADLPTISWVTPDLIHNMHSGTVEAADSWLQTHLSAYVTWAQSNNSLLIVTWDEDNGTTANHIPTIFVGPMVKPGDYSENINHYHLLRTLEAMYGLSYLSNSATVSTISDVWQ